MAPEQKLWLLATQVLATTTLVVGCTPKTIPTTEAIQPRDETHIIATPPPTFPPTWTPTPTPTPNPTITETRPPTPTPKPTDRAENNMTPQESDLAVRDVIERIEKSDIGNQIFLANVLIGRIGVITVPFTEYTFVFASIDAFNKAGAIEPIYTILENADRLRSELEERGELGDNKLNIPGLIRFDEPSRRLTEINGTITLDGPAPIIAIDSFTHTAGEEEKESPKTSNIDEMSEKTRKAYEAAKIKAFEIYLKWVEQIEDSKSDHRPMPQSPNPLFSVSPKPSEFLAIQPPAFSLVGQRNTWRQPPPNRRGVKA